MKPLREAAFWLGALERSFDAATEIEGQQSFIYLYFFYTGIDKKSLRLQPILGHVEISGTVAAIECKDGAAALEQFGNLPRRLGAARSAAVGEEML